MAKDDQPSLKDAAAALQAELDSFEALAGSLRKMPLASRKNLERAARSLEEAAGFEERLALGLRGLLTAIEAAARSQAESATSILERGREIQARNAEYGEIVARYAALGGEAQELTALAQEIVAAPGQPHEDRLDELLGRMAGLAERVHEIARAAAAKDMGDLGREADALRQRVAAARNKLLILCQRGGSGDAKSN